MRPIFLTYELEVTFKASLVQLLALSRSCIIIPIFFFRWNNHYSQTTVSQQLLLLLCMSLQPNSVAGDNNIITSIMTGSQGTARWQYMRDRSEVRPWFVPALGYSLCCPWSSHLPARSLAPGGQMFPDRLVLAWKSRIAQGLMFLAHMDWEFCKY